jgi:heme/copper-type cytochrome/quinol oxidase subunit 3
MRGKAALIGFLVLEAAIMIVWIGSLAPLAAGGDVSLISANAQIWSGGGYSTTTAGAGGGSAVMATPFDAFGHLLRATLLIAASGLAAWFGGGAFRANRSWLSAALLAAALGLAAGGAWLIITQWSGDTAFPAGSVNVAWLYMATRAFAIQLAAGWVVLALYAVLSIAGISNAGQPLGYHLAVLNWVVVSLVWLGLYFGLYVAPGLGG